MQSVFRWSPESGIQMVPLLGSEIWVSSVVASTQGNALAGTYRFPDRSNQGFHWSAQGGFTSLDEMEGVSTISGDGTVVVGTTRGTTFEPDGSTLTMRHVPGASEVIGAPVDAAGKRIPSRVWIGRLNHDGSRYFCCSYASDALYLWTQETRTFQVVGRMTNRVLTAVWGITADGKGVVGEGSGYDPAWREEVTFGWIWREGEGLRLLSEYLGARGVPIPTNGPGAGLAISDDGETVLGNGPTGGPFTSLPRPQGWLARFSGAESLPAPNRVVPVRRPGFALEFATAASWRYEMQESSDLVRWSVRTPEIVGDGGLAREGFSPGDSPWRFFRVRRLY